MGVMNARWDLSCRNMAASPSNIKEQSNSVTFFTQYVQFQAKMTFHF